MTDNEPQIESGAWDQVLFLGSKEFYLKEFRVKIPVSTDYSKIYFKDPTSWRGPIPLSGKEDYTGPIENSRIRDNLTIFVGGKKTLIVLADLKTSNVNKSLLDSLVWSYQNTVRDLERRNRELENDTKKYEDFMKKRHLERTYMAYIMSIAKHGRDLGLRVTRPPEAEAPAVAVTVGEKEEKKK